MGILNVTPDSFYDGGYYQQEKTIIEQAEKMIQEGATILDIGGYSSRPGADDIPPDIEKERVQKAIKAVLAQFPECLVSVDTFRSEVAKAALNEGACMINDISGGNLDTKMFELLANWNVPYVLMHMKGTPQNMKKQTHYTNFLLDILDYFYKKIIQLNTLGVKDIIIDPGFGFAKSINQNFELLQNLSFLNVLEKPILAGLSRKSLIYKTLNSSPQDALNGTTVLNTLALVQGASILRVHDVKEANECIKLYKSVYN